MILEPAKLMDKVKHLDLEISASACTPEFCLVLTMLGSG